MNENLLDKVSTEKIEALVNALDAVIGDMRSVEDSQLVRFRDNAYYTCLSLTHDFNSAQTACEWYSR